MTTHATYTLLAIAAVLLGLWLGNHGDAVTLAGTGVVAFVAGWTVCATVHGDWR